MRNESENVITLFASFGEREVRDELCRKLHEFLDGRAKGMNDLPAKRTPECRARRDEGCGGLLR